MYEGFFNFEQRPFNVTPDPEFLYYSEQHKEALAHMLYGIQERRGFVLVTGRVGSGKSTLCRALLEELDESTHTSVILNSQMSTRDLLLSIAEDFELQLPNDPRQKQIIDDLHEFLLKEYEKGKNACLIVDESQNLDAETLEQLRHLSNLETDKEKLLQTVLVGQPELENLLNRNNLRQVKQRIAVRSYLSNLDAEETQKYINHRIDLASSGSPTLQFTDRLCRKMFEVTGGNPRALNLVGDRMLVAAFKDETRTIRDDHLDQALEDLSGTQSGNSSEKDLVLHKVLSQKQQYRKNKNQWFPVMNRKLGLSNTLSTFLTVFVITVFATFSIGLWILNKSTGYNFFSGAITVLNPSKVVSRNFPPDTSHVRNTKIGNPKENKNIMSLKSSKHSTKNKNTENRNYSDQEGKNLKHGNENNRMRSKTDKKSQNLQIPNPMEIQPRKDVEKKTRSLSFFRYLSYFIGKNQEFKPNSISQFPTDLRIDSLVPDPLQGQLIRYQGSFQEAKQFGFPLLINYSNRNNSRTILYIPEEDLFWDPHTGLYTRESYVVSDDWKGKFTVLAQSKLNIDRNLKRGFRGSNVKQLQKLLNNTEKYELPTIGIFGPKTERSVKDFQASKGLITNGVADSKTILFLLQENNESISWSRESLRKAFRKISQ